MIVRNELFVYTRPISARLRYLKGTLKTFTKTWRVIVVSIRGGAYAFLLDWTRKHREPKERAQRIRRLQRARAMRGSVRPRGFNSSTGRLDRRFISQPRRKRTTDHTERSRRGDRPLVFKTHMLRTRAPVRAEIIVITMRPCTNKSLGLGVIGLLLVVCGTSLCFLWPTIFQRILQKVSTNVDSE